MVKIKQQLISDTPYKYGRSNKKKYITIHETANTNKGADAQTHADLQSNGNSRAAAWHWQVDDKEAIQSFDHDFQLWHAGDGLGNGNLHSIAIEICVNSDGDYGRAVQNAAELTQYIIDQEGIPSFRVVQHHKWSGKNCPRYIRSGEKGPTWSGFMQALGETRGKIEYEPKTKPAKTKNDNLLRKGDRGKKVKKVQRKLKKLGFYGGNIDGIFGPKTHRAVRRFQKQRGIAVDGIVGPVTRKNLGKAEISSKANLTVDGKWGPSTTRALQKSLGTPVDGILSGQVHNDVTDALYGGVQYGGGGSTVIRALQKKIGAMVDGLLGPATIRALQKYLGTPIDGIISRPSSLVVKEMQKQLNKGTF